MFKKYMLSFVAIVFVAVGAASDASAQQQPGGQQGLATMALEVVSKDGSHQFLV